MMTAGKSERVDKYLWFVRLFKSRSAATEACQKGRVTVAGQPVKPAHLIGEGTTLLIRTPPVTYTYKVTGLPKSRISAKLVSEFISDLTPDDEKNKLITVKTAYGYRPRGTGRPTKKDRREIKDFLE